MLGPFLETLIGGLLTGVLYSLVALGFVLIFKASGVFNFAQGAMVLFAALAMARFAEWIPQWTGIENKIVSNVAAFIIAAAIMFVCAWVIERLVLRHLVNQEEILGIRLLTLHNLRFVLELTAGARTAIEQGRLASYVAQALARLGDGARTHTA